MSGVWVSPNFDNTTTTTITPLSDATVHRKKPNDNEENKENSKRG